MTSKEQAAGPFGLSEVEGPSTSLGVNGPESVLFVRSEVEGPHLLELMRRPSTSLGVSGCLLVMLLSGIAHAEDVKVEAVSTVREDSGQAWSAIGARTLAPGDNMLEASAGYPAISGAYLRGVSSGLNIGGRIGFVYGVEGMFREPAPGFRLQGIVKLRLLDSGKISLGLNIEPGLLYYGSFLQGARVGLTLPVGLRLGIAASSAISVAVLIELPMWVEFGTFGGFNLPILTGGGVEYFITSQLAAFVRARIGPTIRTMRPTEVTFDGSVGIAYRF